MGRERQKKKSRSSIPKVKQKFKNRTKSGRRKVDFLGNETIAKNWDRKLTVTQNYKHLGLSSRLKQPTGGRHSTKLDRNNADADTSDNPFAIPSVRKTGKLVPQEVQVERDPDTGHILRVIRPEEGESQSVPNPLNDPLNDIMDIEFPKSRPATTTGVIAELEAEAKHEEILMAKKRPRQQSQREKEWIARLIEKYGSNINAMVRDRKLNPMQQTEGDISRRLRIWQKPDQSNG